MAVTATLASAISFLSRFGMMMGAGRGQQRPNPIGMILLMILGPLAAMLVQTAISRSREYVADAEGARICGDATWLASGLARLEEYKQGRINQAAEMNPATAHMFIVNPLAGLRLDNLFSTHPPTAERVRRLMAMAPSSQPSPRAAPQAAVPSIGRAAPRGNPWA